MFFNNKKKVEENMYLKRPLSQTQWAYILEKYDNNPIVQDVLRDFKPEYLYVKNEYEHGLMIYFNRISMSYLTYVYSDYGYDKLDYNATRELAYYIGHHLQTENYGVCAITSSTYSPGNNFYTDNGLHIGRPTETNSRIGSELYIPVQLKTW